jgi:hypothetical protein
MRAARWTKLVLRLAKGDNPGALWPTSDTTTTTVADPPPLSSLDSAGKRASRFNASYRTTTALENDVY